MKLTITKRHNGGYVVDFAFPASEALRAFDDEGALRSMLGQVAALKAGGVASDGSEESLRTYTASTYPGASAFGEEVSAFVVSIPCDSSGEAFSWMTREFLREELKRFVARDRRSVQGAMEAALRAEAASRNPDATLEELRLVAALTSSALYALGGRIAERGL